MKANEAPEKIYVDSKAIGDDISTTVHTKRQDYPTCTEYTRTDAFVEKACEWIKKSITNNPECNRIISKKGIITMGVLIEDFKKYMKGENE